MSKHARAPDQRIKQKRARRFTRMNMNRSLLSIREVAAILIMPVLFLGSADYFSYAQERGCKPWQIVPGKCVGRIDTRTSESDLFRIFGRANVRRGEIDIGEGETAPDTILYPEDDVKKVEILWKDEQRRIPDEIRITGNHSDWNTDRGISLGTSLKEVERLNGKPFRLWGFAWDYSGTVIDCNQGRLKEIGCDNPRDPYNRGLKILLRFSPDPKWQGSRVYAEALGEREFLSSDPAIQTMNPRIYQMIIFLRQ